MAYHSRLRYRRCLLGWLSSLAVLWSLVPSQDAMCEDSNGPSSASLSHVSPAGVSIYVPNSWGILRLSLKNPTSEPVEILAATYFVDEPTLQFGRRVRIPAMSWMQTWHPIRMPASIPGGRSFVEFRTLVMESAQQREVLIRTDSGALQFDGSLRSIEGKKIVGLIDRLGNSTLADPTAPNDLLLCAQTTAIPDGHAALLQDRLLPAGDECLQSLDQLVIADSRVMDDQAGLAAIRRWLFGGGNLWVMLDRVDPQVLERLLGDEFFCQVVDRVGLTTVRLETRTPDGNVARDVRDHERPVEFVRVLPSEVEIASTIDGWPAAFWKRYGEGRLLVTTLAPAGWMRKRTAADNNPGFSGTFSGGSGQRFAPPAPAASPDPKGEPWKSPFVPLEPMRSLATDFFQPRSEPRLAQATIEPLVQEYVGYSIPPRWQVIVLLMGLSGLVATLGIWLWRRGRLEILGIVSPVLALSVSAVLVWLGWHQRQAIPAAMASVQFVRSLPGTDDVRVEGVAGFFSPNAGTATAESTRGGWMMPDMTGMQGTTRRMVWTDLDEWQWENLPESSGLMHATLQQSSEMTERLEARATFGPEGLSGRLHALAAHEPSDAMLATRDGRIGVELRDDGTFVARSNAVFTPEQFLAADLLSDEQHRRQRVLRDLLDDPKRRDYPAEPQLLFWSKPWSHGFQFAQNRQSLGSALVAVPLKLQRPPTGTEVSLAAPLLPYRETVGPDDSGSHGLWDYRNREWQQKSLPTATWLRFQVPRVLLPVAVQRGRLTVQVTGPVVRLEIASQRRNQNDVVPIKTWSDPVGTVSLDITDPEVLQVAADGGLLLRVSAGDPKLLDQVAATPDRDAKMSYWRIESLALELYVRTTEAP